MRARRSGEHVDPARLDWQGHVLEVCELCGSDERSRDRREHYLAMCSLLAGDELDVGLSAYRADVHGSKPRQALERLLREGGFACFVGGYGVGKSHMLKTAVNEARRRGRLAVYTTLPALLDHLRRAMHAEPPAEYDGLWDNVLRASLLALDEIDKANDTDWAAERLQLLVDYRYTHWRTVATAYALNDWEAVPGYLRSRLLDPQRSVVVKMQDRDLRRELRR